MSISRQVSQVAGIVVLIATMASPAHAQRGRSSLFSKSQYSLVTLAANEAVQKDLGCSSDEMNKLRGFQDEYRGTLFKELGTLGISFQNLREMTDEKRVAAQAKLDEATVRLNAEYLPKLQQVLVPDQLVRLRQIQIQAAGVEALVEPELVSDLALTADQAKKLTEIRDEFSGRLQGLYRGDGSQEERAARMLELTEERDRKVAEVLTAQQREKLVALFGEPFDVSQVRNRRGN